VVASSFMNPSESRTSQNPNRVRIFGSDQLSKAVAGQKWDRVKVVCTQPFNKVGTIMCCNCLNVVCYRIMLNNVTSVGAVMCTFIHDKDRKYEM